jgi:hypothetical protein
MDSHVADDKLKELRVEDTTVKANRDALQYEIDPAAEKKLLRKIDLHVVPILWLLFMYVAHASFASSSMASWLLIHLSQARVPRQDQYRLYHLMLVPALRSRIR